MIKESSKKRYNVIMITIDGARIDRIRKFKNFRKLINKGAFFSQVIAYAPYTIAGLHSIFSGTYGNKTGVDNYYGSYSFKKNFYKTITQYMKNNDYYTIGDIINELVIPKEGFDELRIHDEYKDNLTDRHSGLLVKAEKLKKEKKNFFLYLHYSNIHTRIKINVSRKYTNYSEEYFDNKEENLKAYDSYLEKGDEYLGVIFNKIKELGLNDSIIIVHSDHGISTGEKFGERTYGVFCYDYTVKAFTFFIQPKIFPIKEIKQLVRTIDTAPTIIDVLGFDEDQNYKKMDGKTMMPLIMGKTDERYGFIEAGNPLKTGAPPRKPNIRAIRTSKWKFIHNYWDDSEELYDIEKDPDEENNLIKTNKDVADRLKEKIKSRINAMRAIIIAAGRCIRLRPLTDNIPKCLLPIDDKSILDYIVKALRSNNVDDIIIIKGYKKEKINFPEFRYYEDDVQNGILSSLMYAKEEMDAPFITTYSDIFVEPEVVETLLKTKGDIVAVVDTDWKDYYVNRKDHGYNEAENVILKGDKILEIGKYVDYKKCDGEFIGMIRCSEKGAKIFTKVYEESKKKYSNKIFQKASDFEKAYLTDLLQEIIDRGYEVNVAKIQKKWTEFDTVEDYERIVNQKRKENQESFDETLQRLIQMKGGKK